MLVLVVKDESDKTESIEPMTISVSSKLSHTVLFVVNQEPKTAVQKLLDKMEKSVSMLK